MMNWLRTNVYVGGLLTLIRVYLGWEWLTGGWHKLSGGFDATKFLTNAVTKPVMETGTNNFMYPNFVSFLKSFAMPNVEWFNVLIPWGEFLVGLGLLLGVLTTAAMFFGLLMNFVYMLAGTVSSNPWMILLGFFIIAAGYNAGRFGGDYWVAPWIRKYIAEMFNNHHNAETKPPGLTLTKKA